MVHFTAHEVSVPCFHVYELEPDLEKGLSNDCVSWLKVKSTDEKKLAYFLADCMQLPSNMSDVEDFSDLVFSTIQYFSSCYQKQILSLRESFVLAIETYSWPGGYLEWFQIISQAVFRNKSGNLGLNDLPLGVVKNIFFEVESCQKI